MNKPVKFRLWKWNKMLIYIYNCTKVLYVSKLARDTNVTYSHTTRVVNEMKRLGWINVVKDGRVSYIDITIKGIKLARASTILLGGIEE